MRSESLIINLLLRCFDLYFYVRRLFSPCVFSHSRAHEITLFPFLKESKLPSRRRRTCRMKERSINRHGEDKYQVFFAFLTGPSSVSIYLISILSVRIRRSCKRWRSAFPSIPTTSRRPRFENLLNQGPTFWTTN